MFTRFKNLFNPKPAPSRNIDVSKLFPPTSEGEASNTQNRTRRRAKRPTSYVQTSGPSSYIRFR